MNYALSRVSSQKLPSIVTGESVDNVQAIPGIPERKIGVKGTKTAFENRTFKRELLSRYFW